MQYTEFVNRERALLIAIGNGLNPIFQFQKQVKRDTKAIAKMPAALLTSSTPLYGYTFFFLITWAGLWGYVVGRVVPAIEQYLFNDWEFAKWLFVLVTLDMITGIIRAMFPPSGVSEVSTRVLMGGFFVKVVRYAIALASIHAVTNFTVQGEAVYWVKFVMVNFDTLLLTFFMAVEFLSIDENLKAIGYGFLPTLAVKKIRSFIENLSRSDKE